MNHSLRLCVDCGTGLFRSEPLRCLSCWRYDVEGFQAMLELGRIGGRLCRVTMRADR